jgi:hypothetical protein
MSFRQRVQLYRVGFGLALLLLFHLLSDAPLPGLVLEWWDHNSRGTPDEVSAYERRFEKVKLDLPARGVVGYRAQLQKKGGRDVFVYQAGPVVAEQPAKDSYWLAQYAVAPVIVDRRGQHPLTIVNSRNDVRLLRSEGQ